MRFWADELLVRGSSLLGKPPPALVSSIFIDLMTAQYCAHSVQGYLPHLYERIYGVLGAIPGDHDPGLLYSGS